MSSEEHVKKLHSSISSSTVTLMQEMEALKRKLAEVQAERDTLTRENGALKEGSDALKAEKSSLEKELAMKTQEMEALSRELAEVKAERDTLTNELQRTKEELDRLQNVLAERVASLDALKKELGHLKSVGDQSHAKIEDLENELVKTRAMLDELQKETEGLKARLAAAEDAHKNCDDVLEDLRTITRAHAPCQDIIIEQGHKIRQLEEIIRRQKAELGTVVCGVGMLLDLRHAANGAGLNAMVTKLLPGASADTSKQIQVGDSILQVDGHDVGGCALDEIKDLILGPRGTRLHLTMARDGRVFHVELDRNGGDPYHEVLKHLHELEKKHHADILKHALEKKHHADVLKELKSLKASFRGPAEAGETAAEAESHVGVGMRLEQDECKAFYVKALVPGLPAKNSGMISVQDCLLSVNGQPVTGTDQAEVRRLIAGPARSKVTLAFFRNGRTFEVSLIRDSLREYNQSASRGRASSASTIQNGETSLERLMLLNPGSHGRNSGGRPSSSSLSSPRFSTSPRAPVTHVRTQMSTHARTHTRTHARTHTHTHTRTAQLGCCMSACAGMVLPASVSRLPTRAHACAHPDSHVYLPPPFSLHAPVLLSFPGFGVKWLDLLGATASAPRRVTRESDLGGW